MLGHWCHIIVPCTWLWNRHYSCIARCPISLTQAPFRCTLCNPLGRWAPWLIWHTNCVFASFLTCQPPVHLDPVPPHSHTLCAWKTHCKAPLHLPALFLLTHILSNKLWLPSFLLVESSIAWAMLKKNHARKHARAWQFSVGSHFVWVVGQPWQPQRVERCRKLQCRCLSDF